ERWTALTELARSAEATREIQGRRYWDFRTAKPLVSTLDVGSVADVVDRGLLHRGLIHRCSRCSAESFLDAADLGGLLRCPRCRLAFSVNDRHWFGVNQNDPPKWVLRVNEMVWQFLDANGDIPVRALNR